MKKLKLRRRSQGAKFVTKFFNNQLVQVPGVISMSKKSQGAKFVTKFSDNQKVQSAGVMSMSEKTLLIVKMLLIY